MYPLLWLAVDLAAGSARAAGDHVEVDTTGASLVRPPTPPATPMAAADRWFYDGEWQKAALALDAVRRTSPTDAQRAQFRLAIALYHLGLLQASYAVFSEISDQPNHLEFDATLPWLAKLATDLPEPADVIERVGKYTHAQIARLAGQRDLYAHLEYLLGRYEYRNRQYERALDSFALVARGSKYWAPSQFFGGISNLQLRRSAPAERAFRGILDAGPDLEDAARMRDLARLSMARLSYSESIRLDARGETTIDARALGAAVREWGAVDASSEYWLDATFEQSWAYFMAGDYSRALGNIHTLSAPYFPDAYYPEAEVLRAVIYLTQCQFEDAAVIVTGMERKYQPVYAELARVLGRFAGDDRQEPFFRFLQQVERDRERGTHEAELPREIEPIVRRAFSDRQLLRNLQYVEALEGESARFARMDPAFRDSPLGSDVEDTLELSREIALRNAATLARDRYQRSLDELGEQLRSASRILVEISRQLGPGGAQGSPSASSDHVVRADPEHVLWPFRDEFWRDELGTYRQAIVSKCDTRQRR
ncbi:MAG TPA: hypothetical protein VLM85_16540 [Polyangiaceae bacterium]|nr:hypothetical protein [Polyangiaceae bacterium]